MKCFFCQSIDTDVVDTRLHDDGLVIKRRRQCRVCSKRFTTYERLEKIPFLIIKRDSRREKYDEDKLRNGIIKAVGKTSVTAEQVEKIVNRTTNILAQDDETEISSHRIGEIVADQLKQIDQVAYIRFASVFRRFVDAADFKKELQTLQKKSKPHD